MNNSQTRPRKWIYSGNDYRKLFLLSRRRLQSEREYFEFERFQGELLVRYLQDKSVPLIGIEALDLGCGFGGYTEALREAGAHVIGLDLDAVRLSSAPVKIAADAQKTPFPGDHFSLVVCSSLIEHIPEPVQLLEEINRILKVNGFLYLSFPPFYSPVGGHQFAPYHLLGEKTALKLFAKRRKLVEEKWVQKYLAFSPSSYADSFGTWGLYRRTIAWANHALKNFQWHVVDRSTRYSPVNFANLPLVGEFLTWHVQYLLRKI